MNHRSADAIGDSWEHSIEWLSSLADVPGAGASVDLLRVAKGRWGASVVARTSMLDLLFTRPGDAYPFDRKVHVSWNDGRYELRLQDRHDRIITGDFCFPAKAEVVLDSFLLQLTGSSGDIGGH